MLQDLNTNWESLEDRQEAKERNKRREIQIAKALGKKRNFNEKEQILAKNRKITEMFNSIPKTEATKIEDEMRKEDIRELREMKANLWRKWRGKRKVMENKIRIPTEVEKLDKKIENMEKKINDYKERKEEQIKRKNKKQKE